MGVCECIPVPMCIFAQGCVSERKRKRPLLGTLCDLQVQNTWLTVYSTWPYLHCKTESLRLLNDFCCQITQQRLSNCLRRPSNCRRSLFVASACITVMNNDCYPLVDYLLYSGKLEIANRTNALVWIIRTSLVFSFNGQTTYKSSATSYSLEALSIEVKPNIRLPILGWEILGNLEVEPSGG